MADPKKMSVEEILAACRRMDGGGGEADDESSSQPPPAEVSSEPPELAEESPPSDKSPGPPTSGKKAGEMSVEEMIAAARAEKSGGASKPESKPAAAKQSAAPAGKKPSEMSVEEMLAAARAEKSKPAEKKAAKPAAAKPSAKKASPKASKSAAPASEGPRDTASILAAARKADKRGPMSKAEAAAKAEEAGDPPPQKKKGPVPPMPEKPAYARAAAPSREPEGETRRGFFGAFVGVFLGSSLAAGFSSLLVTNLLWLLGLARFMFPNILTEPPTNFKVGFPDDYGQGQVQTQFKAEFGVWIVRDEYEGQPQIFALQTVCTHLGCTPNWLEGEQKFKCPCHGSGFYKDGINFEGPAPRPLERFAIRLADDGQLEVDKSRKFLEEKGEWKDTASFVPV